MYPDRSKPVEDSARGLLQGIMNEIIQEEKLPLDGVDVQWSISQGQKSGQRRDRDAREQMFADFIIWKSFRVKPACIIEYKPPRTGWTPFTYALMEDAEEKATTISPQSPYFATWNTTELVLFKTFDDKANDIVERRKGHYLISDVADLKDLWRTNVKSSVKDTLTSFLKDFVSIYEGKKNLIKLPADSFFVHVIRSFVNSSHTAISESVIAKFNEDREFRNDFLNWFREQGWLVPQNNDDFDRASRQYSYLLIDKILFYYLLRANKYELQAISIPSELDDSDTFRSTIQSYFNSALIKTDDFESVFGVNFIESLPIPNGILTSLITFVNGFRNYDVSEISYADIGSLYDNLIPENDRHVLGQYFTKKTVVDLINCLCIQDASDFVADFGCGVGTFLVQAYALKKYLNKNLTHIDVLRSLYGTDISKFASHLSVINLTIRDLPSAMNYPQIANADFFTLKCDKPYPIGVPSFKLPRKFKRRRTVSFREFDAIVGNPPYTRENEIEERTSEGYKDKIIGFLKSEWGNKYDIPKKAGMHIYFFMHALRFLRNGGRLGYVTSNSWLDVNYGDNFKKFLLSETKIITIIEPMIEKWFDDPEVNTMITVVEKCSSKRERDSNEIAFVSLKRPLNNLIESKSYEEITQFVEGIVKTEDITDNEDYRVIKMRQSSLYEEDK